MKFGNFLVACLMATTLMAGCSKDKDKNNSEGVTPDGYCTKATVDQYNLLVLTLRRMQSGQMVEDDVSTVLNTCNRLNQLLGRGLCLARNLETGSMMNLEGSKLQQGCDEIRRAVKEGDTANAELNTQFSTAAPELDN